MNISKISNTSFNSLLTISGPNKKADIVINTKAISSINNANYIGEKEGSILGIGNREGAVLTMNNGTKISTFTPVENIIGAYKQSEANGEATLKLKYDPIMSKPIIA